MAQSWMRAQHKDSCLLFGPILLVLFAGVLAGCNQDPIQRRNSYFENGKKYYQEKKYDDAAIEFKNAVKADPRFTEGYYYLGLTQKQRGDLQASLQAFTHSLDINPQQAPAELELGNLYLIGNHPDRARQYASEVLSREPKNFSAQLLVAQSYLAQKNYPQALIELEKATALRPREAPLQLAIGIAQLGNGDTASAATSFEHALALDPTSVDGYRDLANLHQKLGQFQPAEQTLRQGLKATSGAPALYLAMADLYCRWGRVADAQATIANFEAKQKSTADLHSGVGDFWVAHNQLPSALAEYRIAYSLSPSLLLKKKFVNVYITMNDVPDAIRWNQQILSQNPKDRQALMFAGAITHLQGRDADAVEQLRKALEGGSASVFGHYYLGVSLMALGKDDSAQSEFYQCLKMDPSFSFAFLQLGQLSLRAKDAVGAAHYARQVLLLDPSMVAGYLLAADAAILSGDTSRAQKALFVASQLSPGSLAIQVRQAVVDGMRRDYAKAEKEYEAVLSRVKDPTPMLAGLAQLYVAQEQTGKAIQTVNAYAAGPGANAELFVLLAQLHVLQNNLATATTDCQHALQLNPKSASAYFYLGRIAQLRGDGQLAIENYARAGNLDAKDSQSELLAGNLSLQLNRWADAQDYYQRALQRSPGIASAQAGLARAMIEQGEDSNVALGFAQQARASEPSDPSIADTLGWVYMKKGMASLAIPPLQQAVARMPRDAVFRFHLGLAYSAAGQKREARATLLEARRLGLDQANTRQAEETLTELEKRAKTK